jgi:hypothetical protein
MAYVYRTFFLLLLLGFAWCNRPEIHKENQTPAYLNHNDTVRYVGMQACRNCHPDKYETFLHTGMGLSFDSATLEKSSAVFKPSVLVKDACANLNYTAQWRNKNLFIKEFVLQQKDTVFSLSRKVDYIIGSGQHTNSHLSLVNGYVHQMPMTFYTQSGKWDLPPGFENCNNSRFSRKIGLECMTCHNALPDLVKGSENKYTSIPDGISCERCHGPGGAHVSAKQKGEWIDTSKYIDYSIVNPAKLPIDLQFDVCQRCHLQGTAVLENNHSFFDFKPGMRLRDYITVYLPRYADSKDHFIMASHADRLKQSRCMIVSNSKANPDALRPYKNGLTCVNCHNPHVSVRNTNKDVFNDACRKCHGKNACTENPAQINALSNNCVSCHMPVSGSLDIPHVTVHDHRIAVHRKKKEVSAAAIKKFLGLSAINNPNPSYGSRAKAYLQYAEKVSTEDSVLDSAANYISKIPNLSTKAELSIQEAFLRNDFPLVIQRYKQSQHLGIFSERRMSWDNHLAWLHYRVGDAALQTGNLSLAVAEFEMCNTLAPFVPDFMNKWGSALFASGDIAKSEKVFTRLLQEDSLFAPAWCNLGYIAFIRGNIVHSEKRLLRATQLQPNYYQAFTNLSRLYESTGEVKKAKLYRGLAEGSN